MKSHPYPHSSIHQTPLKENNCHQQESVSCKLSLAMSENVLDDNLTGYRILSWQSFFLHVEAIISLSSGGSCVNEKSAFSLSFLWGISYLFSLVVLKIVYLCNKVQSYFHFPTRVSPPFFNLRIHAFFHPLELSLWHYLFHFLCSL